ncbi:type II secretion system F family protein [Nocardioides sp. P86]|uniref:type II secretion system F family protein n=1 Tax=Nocardioides sp. P86 TaxID=2939569 RepID=UPI00203CC293|nr:type II secretion system F family protein [Nocardioides sp. P86]MCM3516849.1 type II secretion system F family protein [Nocardioides sp. P86]
MTPGLLAALAAAAAVALLLPSPARPPDPRSGDAWGGPAGSAAADGGASGVGWLHRHRLLWSLLGAVGAWAFVSGTAGAVLAPAVGAAVWVGVGRAEPAPARREREAVRRELPHLVALVGSALGAGASPGAAVELATAALPGPAAQRLEPAVHRLRLGLDPGEVWRLVTADADLAPLGRALGRAHETGAPVVAAVERLAEELARSARADVEDRARAVGVRAAAPLGLCLLPAFLLVGIVPVVAGLLESLAW